MDSNPVNSESPKPALTRRDAIKAGGAVAAVGAATWALKEALTTSPMSTRAASEEQFVKTTCSLCPSGCGLEVRVVDGKAVKVEGNSLHPLNQGVCCLRGQCSLEILYSPERLAHPRIQRGARGSGDWQEVPWNEAMDFVAGRLRDLRTSGKPHQVALVHGELRGQMRSMVERFMEAYGSPNVINRDSLSVQAVRQAMFLTQGINGLPAYDLNNASYIMTFGGNLLESGRNVIANLGAVAFMRRGRPQRGKLVAVHPRLSLTGMKADEWIPIRPAAYGALALGMANVMINSELYDADFVRDFTFGFEDFTDNQGQVHQGFKSLVLEKYTLDRVASITGIASEVIARLAGEFATNRPAIAIMPAEPDELNSGNALFTAMAIHALNALVGSIDVIGGVLVQRFPTLAAWPEYTVDETGRTGLAQPRIDLADQEGSLAASIYQNLTQALASPTTDPLQALILVHANPVYDLPSQGKMAEALEKTPFIVCIAHTLDETAALADVVLPASTFMECWGDDFIEGVGYSGVSLRRPVVEPVTDSRDPGDILLDLAARLGGPIAQALPYQSYLQAVQHRLSGAPLEWKKLDENGFWAEMVYFNAAPGSPAWSQVVGRDRLFAPQDGRFDLFPRELFAMIGWKPEDDARYMPGFQLSETLEVETAAGDYPLLLISQGLITHSSAWQGVIPTLQEAIGLQGHVRWESWVEISPSVGESMHLKDGDPIWIESAYGKVQAVVRLYPGLWPNAAYLPPGMGHHTLVKWGRNSAEQMVLGCNPARLSQSETGPATEAISGQAITGPVRVRLIRA